MTDEKIMAQEARNEYWLATQKKSQKVKIIINYELF